MNLSELMQIFEAHEDASHKFEQIDKPLHRVRDICAMLTIDAIAPFKRDAISAAEHDQIWFDVDIDAFCAKATPGDVLTLIRCGVFFDSGVDSLSMFR